MGWAEHKLPCPECPSSDAYFVDDKGWGYCFSCGAAVREGSVTNSSSLTPKYESKDLSKVDFVTNGVVQAIRGRKLSEEICKKWDYSIGNFHGKKCHVANFYDKNRKLVGQKLRFEDKGFTIIGKIDGLFGKHLWLTGGKTIIITEGEIDALSVSESNKGKYPVVSIPHGAQSAKKTILKEREWLEGNFENIVLMFDQDEQGRKAAEECAQVFTPGKCGIASLSEKDASDCLVEGKVGEIIKATFNAKPYRPDGIVLVDDIEDIPIVWGLESPYESLTNWTYGFRPQELYTLGAGTGIGKTEFFKEIIVKLRRDSDQKVGILFLEEAASHTVTTLTGKLMGKAIHVPDTEYEEADREAAERILKGDEGDSLVLYNHFGHLDFETIKSTIRHMVVSMGCKFIFLDHITAIVQGEDNIDKKLGKYISELASLIRELDVTLFMISHLNTPDGVSHEEGGRVTLKNLYGSRAIAQWSNFVFALERNQQDEEAKNVSTLRVLKDRYTGISTGKTCKLQFDHETTALREIDNVY